MDSHRHVLVFKAQTAAGCKLWQKCLEKLIEQDFWGMR